MQLMSKDAAREVIEFVKRALNRKFNAGLAKTKAVFSRDAAAGLALRRGVIRIGRKCRQGLTMCTSK